MIHGVELITNAKDMVATDLVTDSSTLTLCERCGRNNTIHVLKEKRKNTLQYPSVQWSLQLLSL